MGNAFSIAWEVVGDFPTLICDDVRPAKVVRFVPLKTAATAKKV